MAPKGKGTQSTQSTEKTQVTLESLMGMLADAVQKKYPGQSVKIIFTTDRGYDFIVTDEGICIWPDYQKEGDYVTELTKGRTYNLRIAGGTRINDDGDPMMPIHWNGNKCWVNSAYLQEVTKAPKKAQKGGNSKKK